MEFQIERAELICDLFVSMRSHHVFDASMRQELESSRVSYLKLRSSARQLFSQQWLFPSRTFS